MTEEEFVNNQVEEPDELKKATYDNFWELCYDLEE